MTDSCLKCRAGEWIAAYGLNVDLKVRAASCLRCAGGSLASSKMPKELPLEALSPKGEGIRPGSWELNQSAAGAANDARVPHQNLGLENSARLPGYVSDVRTNRVLVRLR